MTKIDVAVFVFVVIACHCHCWRCINKISAFIQKVSLSLCQPVCFCSFDAIYTASSTIPLLLLLLLDAHPKMNTEHLYQREKREGNTLLRHDCRGIMNEKLWLLLLLRYYYAKFGCSIHIHTMPCHATLLLWMWYISKCGSFQNWCAPSQPSTRTQTQWILDGKMIVGSVWQRHTERENSWDIL